MIPIKVKCQQVKNINNISKNIDLELKPIKPQAMMYNIGKYN